MTFSDLLIFALVALPAPLLWAFFWRLRFAEPEPHAVSFALFGFGILAAAPLLALRVLFQSHPEFNFIAALGAGIGSIAVLAALEEIVKGLLLIFGIHKFRVYFNRPEDGFEFAAMVALGFAFAENIFYFFDSYSAGGISPAFWFVYFARSLGTVLAHVLFTGSFGIAYGLAYTARRIVPEKKIAWPLAHFLRNLFEFAKRPFHIFWRHIVRGARSIHGHEPGQVIIEGFFFAAILHAVFNSILSLPIFGQVQAWLVIPILSAGLAWYATRWKHEKKPS